MHNLVVFIPKKEFKIKTERVEDIKKPEEEKPIITKEEKTIITKEDNTKKVEDKSLSNSKRFNRNYYYSRRNKKIYKSFIWCI